MTHQIDRYSLLHRIGSGASGVVWEAQENLPGGVVRTVALKVLPPLPLGDDDVRQRFLGEARALAQLSSHPHIVNLLNFGIEEDGTPWIAMEHIGVTLRDRIGEEPGSPDEVLLMLREVAGALQHMHNQELPIVHRDVKPANILIDEFGHHKLTDFGLASTATADGTYEAATVQYVAPEALNPELGPVSAATDLYSLGHVAYEMALGRLAYRRQFPFVYDSEDLVAKSETFKWMSWHVSLELVAPPIHTLCPSFPADLSAVVAKLMAKPLDERYQHVGELSADLKLDLETVANNELSCIEAKPETGAVRPSPMNLRRLLLGGVASSLICVLLMVILATRANPSPQVMLVLDRDRFVSDKGHIEFSGRAARLRPEDRVVLVLASGSTQIMRALTVKEDGVFQDALDLAEPQRVDAVVEVRSAQGEKVASQGFVLERVRPDHVRIVFETLPPTPGVEIEFNAEGGIAGKAVTGPDGRAQKDLPPGTVSISTAAGAHEAVTMTTPTGYDSPKVVPVALKPAKAVIGFNVVPPLPAVEIRAKSNGLNERAPLDAAGRGSIALDPGEYSYVVDASSLAGYASPSPVAFTVYPGKAQNFDVELEKQPRLDGETASIDRLSSVTDLLPPPPSVKELKNRFKKEAPAGVVTAKENGSSSLLISGAVFNEAERQQLQRALGAGADCTTVSINPQLVAAQFQRDLRQQGLSDASARVFQEGNQHFLLLEYTEKDSPGTEAVRKLISRYVLDHTLVRVQAYP